MKKRGKFKFAAFLIPIGLVFWVACKSEMGIAEAAAREGSELTAAWVSKAARILRYKGPIVSREEMDHFLSLGSKDRVVDELMQDKRFYLQAYDFNLYFLGFKKNTIFNGSSFDQEILREKPQAFHSAWELSQDGNYFSLLEYQQPSFTLPKGDVKKERYYYEQLPGFSIPENLDRMSNSDIRIALDQYVYTNLDLLLASAEQETMEATCDKVNRFFDFGNMAYLRDAYGIPRNFRENVTDFFSNECAESTIKVKEKIIAELNTFRLQYEEMRQAFQLLPYEPHSEFDNFSHYLINHKPKLTGQFSSLRSEDSAFTFTGFWQHYINSSTNFNRKRAAAILKTYFCDNLTPINIATPDTHTQGDRHATDSACQACHYKLDPMAGYFKDMALSGFDSTKFPNLSVEERQVLQDAIGISLDADRFLVFDDLATVVDQDYDRYMTSWKNPDGHAREWNIGYIRSASNERLNTYGTTFADLQKLIAEAPEVKQCLSKRMVEFYIGNNQIYDEGWLNSIYTSLVSEENSSVGFKKALRKIVKSNAFAQSNPVPTQCYDYETGVNPADRPPCEVAFNLEKNCTTCHNKNFASKGLDLQSWVDTEEQQKSFKHIDPITGKQKSFCETMSLIQGRLSTTDASMQMPLGRHMSPQDREKLYLWIANNLVGC